MYRSIGIFKHFNLIGDNFVGISVHQVYRNIDYDQLILLIILELETDDILAEI